MSLTTTLAHKLAKRARRVRDKAYWTWRNAVSRARLARELGTTGGRVPSRPIADLCRYEMKVSSQHGEDGILDAIFRAIGTTNRYCVEFGVGGGRECNTARLIRTMGWSGLWMDGRPASAVRAPTSPGLQFHQEFITAENIRELFARYSVPREFDLFSIDIDGNDYWVWKKLADYHPRVIVAEYNASIPLDEAKVIAYDSAFVWQKTDYYGASLLALERLARARGYALVACDESGANAFFVDRKLAEGSFVLKTPAELFKPARYRAGGGHPRDPHRSMIEAPAEVP